MFNSLRGDLFRFGTLFMLKKGTLSNYSRRTTTVLSLPTILQKKLLSYYIESRALLSFPIILIMKATWTHTPGQLTPRNIQFHYLLDALFFVLLHQALSSPYCDCDHFSPHTPFYFVRLSRTQPHLSAGFLGQRMYRPSCLYTHLPSCKDPSTGLHWADPATALPGQPLLWIGFLDRGGWVGDGMYLLKFVHFLAGEYIDSLEDWVQLSD